MCAKLFEDTDVGIEIEIGLPPGSPAFDFLGSLENRLIQAAEQEIAGLMLDLGIPGRPRVSISAKACHAEDSHERLRLRVNHESLAFSNHLIRWLYSFLTGRHGVAEENPDHLLGHMLDASRNDPEKFVKFVVLGSVEAIKSRPSMLLGLTGIGAYIDSLPIPEQGLGKSSQHWESAGLLPLLRETLDLRISIADRQTVANSLIGFGERGVAEVAEGLIAALRPGSVEIRLSPEYLRQIMASDPVNELNVFVSLRGRLFQESGLIYPAFRFMPDKAITHDGFAFTVNHLDTLPILGLKPGQRFVDHLPEESGRLGNAIIPATNPETDQTGYVIEPSSPVSLAPKDSLNDLQYLAIALRGVLRTYRACFIDCRAIQEYLGRLHQTYPALVNAVKTEFSLAQLARILRARVAEQGSIRDLRDILEKMLDR